MKFQRSQQQIKRIQKKTMKIKEIVKNSTKHHWNSKDNDENQ